VLQRLPGLIVSARAIERHIFDFILPMADSPARATSAANASLTDEERYG
jgi:hypothetical protein